MLVGRFILFLSRCILLKKETAAANSDGVVDEANDKENDDDHDDDD